jgi:hypothetical protein
LHTILAYLISSGVLASCSFSMPPSTYTMKSNCWLPHLNLSGKLKRYAMKSNSWLTHLNLSCKIKRYTMKINSWLKVC